MLSLISRRTLIPTAATARLKSRRLRKICKSARARDTSHHSSKAGFRRSPFGFRYFPTLECLLFACLYRYPAEHHPKLEDAGRKPPLTPGCFTFILKPRRFRERFL